MKILGIMGSPRIGGNTDLLLEEALQGARSGGAEVEKVIVDKLKIAPCRECYGCLRDGNCVIRDDMDEIYPKLLNCEGIIIASPIFFYSISAQLKALIDRSQSLWARKYILKQKPVISPKKGAFIAVGATKGDNLFAGAVLTVKYFFKTIDADYTAELLIRGIDQKDEIKQHPAALAEAFALGKKLAE
ncbi:MAG: flavodoxin family protein [Dehalococcoidales bacterium]|nr:flavodoxin family protein [Dehalococcoidales bacterium]